MKIRRIEIIGFKSFVDKTVLNFEDGITAILGPNGCGKSNVVDAIRWGMGEQNAKHLRGQSMEDVIFGGSEKRRAHGMAEVTLVFANNGGMFNSALNDYAEIMVTRRLYRNGDSEYLLNKTPCRLKDIAELFMDTGVGARAYSIIEQGKIGMILHSRPEERRVLIEEVAGVTKYKVRKRAAVRKIEATRQNLIRLNDIITEVQHQLDGLRRQASKAQRFRDLRNQLKELELSLSLNRWQGLNNEAATQDAALAQSVMRVTGLETGVACRELQLEQQRLRHGEADEAVTRVQNQLFQRTTELQNVENKLELEAQQRANMADQVDDNNAELRRLQHNDLQHGTEVARLQGLKGEVGQQLQDHEQQRGKVQAEVGRLDEQEGEIQADLDKIRSGLLGCHSDLSRQQGQRDNAAKQLDLLQERKQRHGAERLTVAERQQEVVDLKSACAEHLHQTRQLHADGVQEQKTLQHHHHQLQQELAVLRPQVEDQRQRFHRCGSRLESLQELDASKTGYVEGIKTILKHPKLRTLFGAPLADGIRVVAGYDKAVAAALGECLQGLPLSNVEDLLEVEQIIAQDVRCLFQLAWTNRAVEFSSGVPLFNLIEASEVVAPFLATLTQGFFCVDSLNPFLQESLPVGVVLVTPQGDCLDWQGRLVRGGGATQTHQLLQNKRRINELSQQAAQHQDQLQRLELDEQGVSESVRQSRVDLQALELEQHRHQVRIEELLRERTRLIRDVEHWGEREELLAFETQQWVDEEYTLRQSQQQAVDAVQVLELKRKELEESAHCLDGQRQQHSDGLKAEQNRLTRLQVNIAELKEREKSLLHEIRREQGAATEQRRRCAQLRERLERLTQQQAALMVTRQQLEMRIQVLVEHCQQDQRQLDALQERAALALLAVEENDRLTKQGRADLLAANEEHSTLQMTVQECHLERDHLRQLMLDKYQVDFDRVDHQRIATHDGETLVGADEKLIKLRTRLDSFGEVNLMAIDEFTALEERFTFLTQQRSDLQCSIDDLQSAISQINRTSRRRFKEAFEQVNAKFKEVFPRLFVGGDASLSLTNEGDLLESGVEIIAQPPGKKLQNISLLSGGEKALTAVALIFAIFLIKPSPFCILDEVDAPLDDANIGRFNEMVKEMSVASQFVIITHNTRTMEIADTLFGVTMEDPGVSCLVSVRVGEMMA